MTTDKEKLREALCTDHLLLATSYDYAGIFTEMDSFVAQSQGNDTVACVHLSPYYDGGDPGNYILWDKVGQGVGNLKSLSVLVIHLHNRLGGPRVDWEILARILLHISIESKIQLRIIGAGPIEGAEEMLAFARAIQEHPAITRFDTSTGGFSFENLATLCSALTTLPNLECAVVRQQRPGRAEVPTFQSPESMTEFLRAPSLRIVEFRNFCFTSSLCLATAMALSQGSSITSLVLEECSFPEGGSEKIASALKENTTLTTFKISPSPDTSIHQAFYDAVAASLLSNSTLQELSIRYPGATDPISVCVSPLLMALGTNKTLRQLRLSGLSFMGGSVIPALRHGLGKNSTLEILELIHIAHITQPSFRIRAVEALQLNKTIKTLCINYGTQKLTDDDAKHLTSVVKKNYRLNSLPGLDSSDDRTKDLRSILRLNEAGRGYLPDGHGSVVSRGVDVLSAVSDDINCVFLHMLENPSLCNRNAILKRFRAGSPEHFDAGSGSRRGLG
jgi:hypothetical protein